LKRLRFIMVAVALWATAIPAAICAFAVRTNSGPFAIMAIAALGGVVAVCRIALGTPGLFGCPRCRRSFFPPDGRLLTDTACQHCGLAVGAAATDGSGD
jgi:hypothetical protein